ncbi:hypothetical protein V7182_14320 [Neobacillus drentensis]|uniref:hypothetical protein n=1 Tax=Neobacillus drentensis TaxID=220684 RepID=UPI003000F349
MGKMKNLVITLVIIFALVSGLVMSTFGSAIYQEGNPLPILVSAIKLQFSDSNYAQFSKTEKRSRYLSEKKGNDGYLVVEKFMKSKGWSFREQMGSGLIFTKNGEDAVVEVRQYSKHYFIWEIQKAFFQ